MVKVKKDLTGKQFGRLVVIEQAEDYISPTTNQHFAQWLCECSCEKHKRVVVLGSNLTRGSTTSCGCARQEAVSLANSKQPIWLPETFEDEYGKYKIGITYNTNNKYYVDLDDWDSVKNYCWSENIENNFHKLVANIDGNTITMHTLLGFQGYDHIDRNELNNRKYNLRKCTQQENCFNHSLYKNNRSGVIGVHFSNRDKKWIAQIGFNNQRGYIGSFDTKDEAIRARLLKEQELYGEFAPQQHLYDQYNIERKN